MAAVANTIASAATTAASVLPNPIPDFLNPFAGEGSPFASHPKSSDPDATTDLIWLLDSTAARDETKPNAWHSSMVAAFFTRGTGKIGQQVVTHVIEELRKTGLLGKQEGEDEVAKKRVEERVLPFFREVLEGKKVDVRIRRSPRDGAAGAAVAEREIGPSDGSGVARDEVAVTGQFADGDITQAQPVGGVKHIAAYTTYAAPEGWAVISDIDDTIKVTLTDHVAGVLKTTFLDDPQPIRGMPELYWHLNEVLKNPPFWYLSASPYNLYEFLHEFRDAHFPRGTFELRNASWQNITAFLSSVNKGTKDYKVDKMEKRIFQYWPKRKFICLGDSTQTDPEAYGEMARRHPEWVGKIFIRKVENIIEPGDGLLPGRSDEERNKSERFEKAFTGLDKSLWYVFEEPEEVKKLVDELVMSR